MSTGSNKEAPGNGTDKALGYAKRYAYESQAQQPYHQLNENAHHEQLGRRIGARSGNQSLQVFDENENPSG